MNKADMTQDSGSVAVERKLARLRAGGQPRVVDLFAGCGGISLGFLKENFQIMAALEHDSHAAHSHALNFHGRLPDDQFRVHAQARDITEIEPADLLRQIGCCGPAETLVDVIVGGPPCQAYTRIGRAKLREVARHPQAYLSDPRRELYLRYLQYVRELLPLALLMENVPDVLNQNGHNVGNEVCEALESLGYTCRYTLLNTVHYGVPQTRERMFLIAYRAELGEEVLFPVPSYHAVLPRGYHEWRRNVLGNAQDDLFSRRWFMDPPPSPDAGTAPAAVTVRQAIRDLPAITLHLEGRLNRAAQRFGTLAPYRTRVRSGSYAHLMRNWCGFESREGITDHVIRNLPRDWPIFQRMKPGDTYSQALECAEAIFMRRLLEEKAEGRSVAPGSAAYWRIRKEVVPPYDPGKFPDKWRKMEPNRPARTLMAHLSKDCYSHIHYDDAQARTLSVREAARLQSFPDGFRFHNSMNAAFRQIGNAVPPLMAAALARVIREALENGARRNDSAEVLCGGSQERAGRMAVGAGR